MVNHYVSGAGHHASRAPPDANGYTQMDVPNAPVQSGRAAGTDGHRRGGGISRGNGLESDLRMATLFYAFPIIYFSVVVLMRALTEAGPATVYFAFCAHTAT